MGKLQFIGFNKEKKLARKNPHILDWESMGQGWGTCFPGISKARIAPNNEGLTHVYGVSYNQWQVQPTRQCVCYSVSEPKIPSIWPETKMDSRAYSAWVQMINGQRVHRTGKQPTKTPPFFFLARKDVLAGEWYFLPVLSTFSAFLTLPVWTEEERWTTRREGEGKETETKLDL